MLNREKLNWLFAQPISAFSYFGAVLVAETWSLTHGGEEEFVKVLPEGRKMRLEEVYNSMQGSREDVVDPMAAMIRAGVAESYRRGRAEMFDEIIYKLSMYDPRICALIATSVPVEKCDD